ncbi:multimerin-1 isoform X2 [Peromyscus californicus insignis]|uniref:multimerin-1 isoform X2 n=1 Tax=Peromyscus californicus insignis TaxID=564181 RepID=UPI0022A6E498|nr:multimerin-1 isoform X2 [Peromyscus californicus insignis]
MRGLKLLVLLSSLWGGGFGLTNTQRSWTAPEDENAPLTLNSPSAPLVSLQVLSATQNPSSKAAAAPERPSEDTLLLSTLQTSETNTQPEERRSQTPTPLEKTGAVMAPLPLALQSKPITKPGPGAEKVVLANATLKFLQSFSRKSNQQAISSKLPGDMGNRSPRETHRSRSDSSGGQRPSYQKSSFETTRGKNWCAHVHTKLSPTVILDTHGSYVPKTRGSCGWSSGLCSQRSQKTSNAVYRMQHKIVTSLEWRCCPGYIGPNCQLKAEEQQQLAHSNQAESHTAVDQETAQQPQQQQKQDGGDPAVIQKMAEQMSQQAKKLTLLQKKVDNVSLAADDMRKAYLSLEGKIGEDKGKEFQPLLKALKSKGIDDLLRNIVKEQFKAFQNNMQETIAQLFKTVSSLSEDLESTRQAVLQVNQSLASVTAQQKLVFMQENQPTWKDITDLKNNITNVRQEMALTCEKPVKELEAKQAHLEGALGQERSQLVLYHQSLNETLSKMQEAHTQLLSVQQVSGTENVATEESGSSNVTKYISVLQETASKQGLMLLQMLSDLHAQESKISNLTISLEMEKESVRGECEEMLSKCRHDFKFQLKDTEENLHVLNQTLSEVIFPMDIKVDKISEQLNDLTYDMEILQPLLEQRSSIRQQVTHEPKEAIVRRRELQNLIGAINRLNVLIKELTKRHSLLRNEVQSQGEAFERRISDHVLETEDGLNKTMTVINNAIDFVQDNYVLKDSLSSMTDNPKLHEYNQNIESILTFISEFQHLNDSIQTLVNDNQKYNFVLQIAKALTAIPKDEKLSQLNFQKIYQMFNETTSQVNKCQQNMSYLEENILSATKTAKEFESRLQGIESKVTKTLIPYYISFKKGDMVSNQKDTDLQLKVLTSRFKALEAKSIHLSVSFSLLNKTVHELSMTCHNASASACGQNAPIPTWTKGPLPDSQSSQKSLTELVESIVKKKTQAALSNLTLNVDRLLSDSLANTVKPQKQVKPQKKPSTLKKSVNVTTILIGRTQRNTDSITLPAQEHSRCSSFPCQNGGTCISGKGSFVCACRHPFTGDTCAVKSVAENALAPDFSKGSYRYAPMVAFFVSHTHGMTKPGPILFNDLGVNYGASYNPSTGRFRIPYLGVYIFKYTIESFSAHISGFLVVDGVDKLTFESENTDNEIHCDRVLTGDALFELNYGQEVWLRLVKGTIPIKYPPVTTFSGFLLYRT